MSGARIEIRDSEHAAWTHYWGCLPNGPWPEAIFKSWSEDTGIIWTYEMPERPKPWCWDDE